jgi:hypothetical protein
MTLQVLVLVSSGILFCSRFGIPFCNLLWWWWLETFSEKVPMVVAMVGSVVFIRAACFEFLSVCLCARVRDCVFLSLFVSIALVA